MHLSFCSEYGYARGSALKPKTNKRFHALRHFGDSQVLSPGLVPNIKGSSSLDSTARARGEGWILLAGVMKGGGQGKTKKNWPPIFQGGQFFFFFLAWLPAPSLHSTTRAIYSLKGGGVDTVGRRHKGGGGKAKKKIGLPFFRGGRFFFFFCFFGLAACPIPPFYYENNFQP